MRVVICLSFIALARAAEICCPDIGCFENTGDWAGFPVPECQSTQQITHELFTRSNRNNGQLVTRSNVPSVWNGNKETVFLIHGWNNNKDTQWLIDAKNNILNRDDKNVIITGWGVGAGRTNYLQSAANTRVVGAETRQIKEVLRNAHGSNIQSYCAGHSLGAHTCGNAGQFEGDRGFNRISGLDPAGPGFQEGPDRRGLNKNCGDLVEAWHTDGKDSANAYGTIKPLGHRDFYPNGGGLQPGCSSYMLGFQDAAAHPDLRDDPLIACSHGRATKYFVQSAESDCFIVRQICSNENNLPGSCSSCSNCPNMGYVQGSGQDGKYYLEVNPATPHCQG